MKKIVLALATIFVVVASCKRNKEDAKIIYPPIILTERNNGLADRDTIEPVYIGDVIIVELTNWKMKGYEYGNPELNPYYDPSIWTFVSKSYVTEEGAETADDTAPLCRFKFTVNRGGRSHITIKNFYKRSGKGGIDYVAFSVELIVYATTH